MTATLFVNISQLVRPWPREERASDPLDVTSDGAVLVQDGAVRAAGHRPTVETAPGAQDASVVDLGGRAVVPGLIDSHTHVVFVGDRIDEFARRARGETYEQIAQAGGGIVRSVEPIRAATIETLVEAGCSRLQQMMERGTTTCEAKSGYGLSVAAELKQLRAIAALQRQSKVSVLATVLAHVVPPEARTHRHEYLARFCRDVIGPAGREGLASFCDVFVEATAFTPDEARSIAAAAREAGLGLKLHVDQLHDGQGAALAAELGALSADHLEQTNPAGRERLAEAGVVATILPGCAMFLGQGPWPNGRALRQAGCEVAVATDCNPGSSMIMDLGLCATLAATRCGLSLAEALWAITAGGARALGLVDRGHLLPGERADFVVVDHPDWRALLYRPGTPPIHSVIINGELAFLANP